MDSCASPASGEVYAMNESIVVLTPGVRGYSCEVSASGRLWVIHPDVEYADYWW